jgi:hypothetical protein
MAQCRVDADMPHARSFEIPVSGEKAKVLGELLHERIKIGPTLMGTYPV